MATPTFAHSAVSVNFNIDISGNSNLNVFGEAAQQMNNVIVAEYLLPVDALYDTSSVGLIELWEDKDNIDDINVSLAHTDGSALPGGFDLSGAWQATAKKLAMGLENVLCKPLDCSGVAPFSAYTAEEEYYKPTDFGHVALGVFAHYMFGHVDATAAITNDKAFLKNMLSLSGAGADAAVVAEDAAGEAARVAAFTHAAHISGNGYVKADWMAQSATDANLARRLAAAVVEKGFGNAGALNVTTVSAAATDKALLSNIVRQVVGQDATRLMNEDGSERTIDQHRLLRFYAGDVIYVNITIKTPSVTVGTGQRNDLTGSALQASYSSEKSYAIKITLAPKA